MTWVAAAVIGGAVIGGVASNMAADKQASAAKEAAKSSGAAAAYQADLQKQMYEQTRADQAPWRGAGELGLSALAYGLGLSPTGYLPGMSDQVVGMLGGNAASYADAARKLDGGDQWEVIRPAGYRTNMQVRNIATGEVRDVPLTTERDITSLKREGVARAMASGWGIQPSEAVPQVGTIIGGPMSKPTAEQVAAAREGMSSATTGMQAAGAGGVGYGDLLRNFGMSDFEADPGYAFRQSEGLKGIERSAAARGGLLSGAALKATERFGQDLASQEYQNAYNRFQSNQTNQFNRLASIAGVGQTANNALQQAGSNYANAATQISQANAANQGNALMAAGQARASGYAGIGNALSGALQNWPQQQPSYSGYQAPQGYQMGGGYLGNAYATSQGYQPLNHAAANAGFYD